MAGNYKSGGDNDGGFAARGKRVERSRFSRRL